MHDKLESLSLKVTFILVQYLEAMQLTWVKSLKNSRRLEVVAFPKVIRTGRKRLSVTNTVAYNGREYIPTVKSYILQGLQEHQK